MPEEIKKEESNPVEWSEQNLPKSKDDWSSLKDSDPEKFLELTQVNVDKLYRKNKELEEKYQGLETVKNNLTVELDTYKSKGEILAPAEPTLPRVEGEEKVYSTDNLPQTDEEWESLAIENPNLHTDLRFYYNQSRKNEVETFEKTQEQSRKVVQKEHPDMYLPELDDSGQVKKDENGKVILKINPVTGEPIFDPSSEKGKLWETIYNENPNIVTVKAAPTLMMAEMERRLRQKGEQKVEAERIAREKLIEQGQVAPEGVSPPLPVKVEYASEEEKRHVEAAIKRGTWSSAEEWYAKKTGPDEGYYEENRMPSFGQK